VYINDDLMGSTTQAGPGTASGDLTVDFTFNDGDVLKIVEVAHSIAEIASLTFSDSCDPLLDASASVVPTTCPSRGVCSLPHVFVCLFVQSLRNVHV
jgi:hypothetical protein